MSALQDAEQKGCGAEQGGCGANGCAAARTVLSGQSADHTVERIAGTDGEVVMTRYPVFAGIDLIYHDVHAASCTLKRPKTGLLEIDHCREGRIEYHSAEGYFYLAPGDLSVVCRERAEELLRFPTGHYHGITVSIDLRRAPECLSCILQDVNVRPDALTEKFCRDGAWFAARSSPRVEHVFSELYAVPEPIRKGYFKVKVLELLLFLTAFPTQEPRARPALYSGVQVKLAKCVRDYLLANTENKVTVSELSHHFGASETLIKSSFRGVYGMSPAAYLRAQKMHGAAQLLRTTDRTVLDIAGQFGYDNASKFAKAFRDVIGVPPNEYRCGAESDSCAPAESA